MFWLTVNRETKGTERPTGLEPLGLFLITDVIREEAPDTLAFLTVRELTLKLSQEMIL